MSIAANLLQKVFWTCEHPRKIQSDQAGEFARVFIYSIAAALEISRCVSSAYHPMSQVLWKGLMEL